MSHNYMTRTKWVIHGLLKKYLESTFDIEVRNNVTKELEAPYLIIGNHQNNWDGFIMSIYNDKQISFVISDEQYRNPIVRRLLQYIDAIPTIKAKIDISTIRRIIQAKKEGRIIGLFPEGNRTWDGRTQYIYYSTAKLIKLLKIPVVNSQFKGGHLAHPRWARYQRKGKIITSFDLLFSLEEIEKLTIDEIYLRLCNSLEHDEFAFQSKEPFPYKGKKLAEKLEYFLFICPHCQAIDHMQSADNIFTCNCCGYTTEYTEYGSFKPLTEKLYAENPRDWNDWQLEQLRGILAMGSDKPRHITDNRIILKQTSGKGLLKKTGIGQLSVDYSNLYFKSKNGAEIIIPIKKIDGLNLQIRNQLDFYYENVLYRLSFKKSKTSPFKWLNIFEIIQAQAKEGKAL